jgi:DNA polymerase-3 subunit epsilon
VDGEVTVNFGRKKGQRLRDLVRDDPGFLKWMLRGDFPLDTRAIVEAAMNGSYPAPPQTATVPPRPRDEAE